MNADYNFMYNVMTNGIGGVNAGGVENGSTFRDNTESLKIKIKISDFLNSPKNIDKALKDGYLKFISTHSKKEIETIKEQRIIAENTGKRLLKEITKEKRKIIDQLIKTYRIEGSTLSNQWNNLIKMRNKSTTIKDMISIVTVMETKRKNILSKKEKVISCNKLTDLGYTTYKVLAETRLKLHYIKSENVLEKKLRKLL